MENNFYKKVVYPLLAIILLFLGVDTFTDVEIIDKFLLPENNVSSTAVVEGEIYDSTQEVVDYIHQYDELPQNYITKREAQELGWEARKGNLWDVAPGKSIGGDYFGNFEELLPDKQGRNYLEADINYRGGYRDGERLVFSDDGLYFYTEDHYETFEEVSPSGEFN